MMNNDEQRRERMKGTSKFLTTLWDGPDANTQVVYRHCHFNMSQNALWCNNRSFISANIYINFVEFSDYSVKFPCLIQGFLTFKHPSLSFHFCLAWSADKLAWQYIIFSISLIVYPQYMIVKLSHGHFKLWFCRHCEF